MNLSDTAVLSKALASTGSPVTIADARQPDMPIVYCNDAFLKLSGYSLDETIGKNCRFLQGEDTDRRQVSTLKQAIDAHEDTSVVLLNYTKDGRPFWNDLRISPVKNDTGEVTHFIGFQNDISARLEQERVDLLIEKIENDLEVSQRGEKNRMKLTSLQQDFLQSISSQLRDPIVSIQNTLQALRSSEQLSAEAAEQTETHLHMVTQQLKAIDTLTSQYQTDAQELLK